MASQPNAQTASARIQSKIRKEPLAALRVFFFVLLWTLALANVVIVVREFQNSLPFVIGIGPRRQAGIEDSRRQALPILVAPCITLITLIPIAVGLPLFGIASFLSRYTVEAAWTGLVVMLTLGGAASLSPQPDSPFLPTTLQSDLSASLGLSFTVVVFLTFYNILLLLRLSFLLGKGVPNLMQATVSSMLNVRQDSPEPTVEDKLDRSQEPSPEDIARVNERLESGSIKTLSSGWDDEDEEKGTKTAKSESRFAKAKSILSSPLKQSGSKP
ncbi:hypothetical protein MJO28_016658 [Puccinia striiformis f. sp. tritici]|uniref:Uncharacterized protein n=2 Tax=Puccinia striiformis f. sp. tritici TaxID=168172 RepID=A0A0L0V791_9BASI|nr:hypothetical protein Pst134EA_030263 [Puccinia striiformis f. sp. tritici]KAI9607041.1 hypothetical protein KEM48_001596 [Puccinia striiformis f. sp. tritici PST-130]KNE95138.1 hypothetical protein PSTG_11506 [Puccinia striiformis f. sp. tritici PST-78]KAH9440175.1 hypothetical protein Pst134EB_030803 [Puccinia striiformis f. sp. tritici]KAH9446342.1 hypothetical protein Pst134EA_030263 [Puccinia striiformis f. sp. tritici]KAI7934721.1 hypothetical protein MJO29_015984 [Puccinia striiformis